MTDLFRADLHEDWRERGSAAIGDRDPLDALRDIERENTRLYGALMDAVSYDIRSGRPVQEVKRESGMGHTTLKSIGKHVRERAVQGDIPALRNSYFGSFEALLAAVAHSHIVLGLKQAEIARAIGSGASTVSSWCSQARKFS